MLAETVHDAAVGEDVPFGFLYLGNGEVAQGSDEFDGWACVLLHVMVLLVDISGYSTYG